MAKSTHYVAKTPDSNGVIHYSQEEQDIWRDLYQRQLPSTQKYAAGLPQWDGDAVSAR